MPIRLQDWGAAIPRVDEFSPPVDVGFCCRVEVEVVVRGIRMSGQVDEAT